MKIVPLLILLFITIPSIGQWQISSIKLEGLERTKESYIQLFIETKPGDIYDSIQLEKDRQRIANLEIIGEVVLQKAISNEGIEITFIFKEMINIIPILSFGKTKGNFWLRTGMQDANINGRGNKLIAYYQNYDGHSIFIDYQVSRIKKKPIGFSGTFIRWSTLEPLIINGMAPTNYVYDNLNTGMAITRYLGYKKSLELGISGFEEYYKQLMNPINILAIESLQRKGGLVKLIFRSNHLNYSYFIIDGYSLKFNAELIKRISVSNVFFIAFSDLKYFKKIGKHGNFATRLRLGLSTNEKTPFAPFVLDNYINIRGVGNRVDRGTGSIVANVEYRQTIFNSRLLASQLVAFADFGSWRKPDGNFTDFSKSKNMQAFSGLGLRLIYKRAFDTMVRLDYGYDYNKVGGFVIGIGQYF